MEQQLVLVEERDGWRLDEGTRARGRQGVAAARAVLAEVARRSGAAA